MPAIRRLLETSLYCEDLERALAFYQGVLGLTPLFSDARLAALDAGGGTVLLLFRRTATAVGVATSGGWIPPHDGTGPVHLALAVDQDELSQLEARLLAHGVGVESRVRWPRGGTSIYCRDPDGHSLELATPGVWATY
jgi:catechol 2,3-dioxygenase-like lactoylglutathione lyase family enzyme